MSQGELLSRAKAELREAKSAAIRAQESVYNARVSKLEEETICLQRSCEAQIEKLSTEAVRRAVCTEQVRLELAAKPVKFSILLFVTVFAGIQAFTALGWL